MLVFKTMNIRSLFLVTLVFSPFAYAETVYKTVAEEGNIIFSDTHTEGAEAIEIKEAQTITIPETKPFDYIPEKEKQTDVQYTKLVITSPKNDTTVHSNGGSVSVEVKIEPQLFEKDLIVLFLDGKQVSSGRATQFSLTNIDRGTHIINVAVNNEKDKLLKRSDKVVFHLRRASSLSTARTPKTSTTSRNTNSSPSSTGIPVP